MTEPVARLYKVTIEIEFAAIATSPEKAVRFARQELDAGSIEDSAYARLAAADGYAKPASWIGLDPEDTCVHGSALLWEEAVAADRLAEPQKGPAVEPGA